MGGSFRDPAGFLFWRDGELFRQVHRSYAADYDHLLASGLYDELVAAGLLVPHEETDEPACEGVIPTGSAAAYKVIHPRRLEFISYPYEWCFSQLKDAALATLAIQRRALARGMWLKDASAYNVQLDPRVGRSLLIDTLSLERYPEGRPWVAYRQFCQHFLAPLALMARCDVRLGDLLRVHLDGIPLDLASRLLPWRTRLSPGLLLHVHAHARMNRRQAGRLGPEIRNPKSEIRNKSEIRSTNDQKRVLSRRSLNLLLGSLERVVEGLEWRPCGSPWGDYYASMHNYTPQALAAKERIVAELLDQARPKTVWDLGANDGRFSRLAARRGALTVCWDGDPACVERNYRTMQAEAQRGLVPLQVDLTNPSPSLGWAHRERMSLVERGPADVVLALGLVHHLAIGNNVPLDYLAEF